MNEVPSFIDIISEAGIVVKFVMLSLVLASIVSWAMIFRKIKQLQLAVKSANGFEQRFWSGGDLSEMYGSISRNQEEAGGMERIFMAGFKEFSRLRRSSSASTDPEMIISATNRAMQVELTREVDALELTIPFLATVGSTSPYVGLFGTVWGIMNSFMALGALKQATLSTVAPGIAEALIATAIGLFAAIPAVIAYNRFSTKVERIVNRYDIFVEEFLGIIQRQAHAKPSDA
ncbi:MAG: protein TolQ [Gammaproteobacteria bacterium]|nr:MAG: protein TolQ [Gammaproteobacteria bacterium]